jgi:8-oxo-dGTP diphosphatase
MSRTTCTIHVACAIVEHEGRILVARRGTGRRALRWEFPGGKIDRGETINACIVREIQEELAIDIRPRRQLPPHTWRYPDIAIVLHPVICGFRRGTLQLREHKAAMWIAPSEADGLQWCDADRKVLELYKQRYMKHPKKTSDRARSTPGRRSTCSR